MFVLQQKIIVKLENQVRRSAGWLLDVAEKQIGIGNCK